MLTIFPGQNRHQVLKSWNIFLLNRYSGASGFPLLCPDFPRGTEVRNKVKIGNVAIVVDIGKLGIDQDNLTEFLFYLLGRRGKNVPQFRPQQIEPGIPGKNYFVAGPGIAVMSSACCRPQAKNNQWPGMTAVQPPLSVFIPVDINQTFFTPG